MSSAEASVVMSDILAFPEKFFLSDFWSTLKSGVSAGKKVILLYDPLLEEPSFLARLLGMYLGRDEVTVVFWGFKGVPVRYDYTALDSKEGSKVLSNLNENIEIVKNICKSERQFFATPFVRGYPYDILQTVKRAAEKYDWFPSYFEGNDCPLVEEDVKILSELHPLLTYDFFKEINVDPMLYDLPTVEAFSNAVRIIQTTSNKVDSLCRELDVVNIPEVIQSLNEQQLFAVDTILNEFEDLLASIEEPYRSVTRTFIGKVVSNSSCIDHGERIQQECDALIGVIQHIRDEMSNPQIVFVQDVDFYRLADDAKRRLQYLKARGFKGFWVFSPKIIRQTNYIEDICLVDGVRPSRVDVLEKLVAILDLSELVEKFHNSIGIGGKEYEDLDDALGELLRIRDCLRKALGAIIRWVHSLRTTNALNVMESLSACLSDDEMIHKWKKYIQIVIFRRRLDESARNWNVWKDNVMSYARAVGRETDAVKLMLKAMETKDVDYWIEALKILDDMRELRVKLRLYEDIVRRVGRSSFVVCSFIRALEGTNSLVDKLPDFINAWKWRQSVRWVLENRSFSNFTIAQFNLINSFYALADVVYKTPWVVGKKGSKKCFVMNWDKLLGEVSQDELVKKYSRIFSGAVVITSDIKSTSILIDDLHDEDGVSYANVILSPYSVERFKNENLKVLYSMLSNSLAHDSRYIVKPAEITACKRECIFVCDRFSSKRALVILVDRLLAEEIEDWWDYIFALYEAGYLVVFVLESEMVLFRDRLVSRIMNIVENNKNVLFSDSENELLAEQSFFLEKLRDIIKKAISSGDQEVLAKD